MCDFIGTEPSLPRRCGQQTHRSNIPGDSPSAYYKRTISIPLLDHLLSEFNSRFTAHQQAALRGMALIPSILVTFPEEGLL